ncbi:predicted protein [Pyrenophora tritici-repentis Pt-1C-BFP]|uniref:Uncharacterized protein n=1 Tax=Pyrenophora tritici-repentis (strain Pt-1C-BFP) TaxID=426418 RepID=B2W951_PYRTR|nr:uncharacterized protein PTRG_06509 [Pyrenophora tritici-repentis Pt-1C-BFP]EDU49429.1 predicted protein [Pyrenophora tritici-repentis Pt-1C-BFP]
MGGLSALGALVCSHKVLTICFLVTKVSYGREIRKNATRETRRDVKDARETLATDIPQAIDNNTIIRK